jgi:hypothetical protein
LLRVACICFVAFSGLSFIRINGRPLPELVRYAIRNHIIAA